MSTKEIDDILKICKNAVQKAKISLDKYVEENGEIKDFAERLKDEWDKGSLI